MKKVTTELELGVDNKPIVYLLYAPEQDQKKDPNLYLWIRRCEVFANTIEIMGYFEKLGITIKSMNKRHELFPELIILEDSRGYKWYCCTAPIYGAEFNGSL